LDFAPEREVREHGGSATGSAKHDSSGHGVEAHGAEGHGGGHAGGHEGAAEHGPGAMNWSDFGNKAQPPYLVSLLNFGLLLFVYWKYGRGPIRKGLADRRDRIAKEIEEAARLKKEAEKRAETYQARLRSLDDEKANVRSAMLEAGAGEKARLIEAAKERAARMSDDVSVRMAQEEHDASVTVSDEVVEKAIAEARALLERSITPQDHAALGEQFLQALGKVDRSQIGLRGGAGGGGSADVAPHGSASTAAAATPARGPDAGGWS
jgi:F-type H+-transporting ATPase subunit b